VSNVTTKPNTKTRQTHLAGIDGLRAFAALSVLFVHVSQVTIPEGSAGKLSKLAEFGDQGLTLFFCLSGFLLFLPFVSALLAGRPIPSVRRYLTNRGLRIFPAYIVIFLVVLAAGALTIHGNFEFYTHSDVGRTSSPSILAPNLLLVQSLVPHANGTGIIPAWSLTAELTFYALLPLVGYLAWFLAKRMSKVWALAIGPIVFLVISLVTNLILGHQTKGFSARALFIHDWGNDWTSVLSRSFLANADLFAWGMFAALIIGWMRQHDRVPRLSGAAKTIAFVLIVAVAFAARQDQRRDAISLVGICAAGMILLTVLPAHDGSRVNGLARVLEWGPIRYVGLISYSIYLWHYPTMLFLREHGLLDDKGGTVALVGNTIIVTGVVLCLASITYYVVEKPAMNLRGRLPARTIELAPVEAMANA
jgi:peptidoglycan/LPS O-acetylase OafA/YrhL